MSKHTPGPWLVVESGHVRTSSLRLVAVANYSREANANARLIAAAPDLLESLKLCIKAATCETEGTAPWIEAVATARAAIAKAEGKE